MKTTFTHIINFRVAALAIREQYKDKFSVFLNCIRHALRNTEEAYQAICDKEQELIAEYIAKDENGFGQYSELGNPKMTTENRTQYQKALAAFMKGECDVQPYRYTKEAIPAGITAENISHFIPFIFTEEQVDKWMTEETPQP